MPRISFIEPFSARPALGAPWIDEARRLARPIASRRRKGGIHSRNSVDLTCRFRSVAAAVKALPCQSVIIKAELVACDVAGKPSFGECAARGMECCAWCFDLMELDGTNTRWRRSSRRHLLGTKC